MFHIAAQYGATDYLRFVKEACAILYRVGAIGIKMQAGERYYYSHTDTPLVHPVTIPDDARIRIHPMLHRALNVSPSE